MSDLINLAASIILPAGLGYIFLSSVLRYSCGFLLSIALSFGLGLGMLAYFMLIIGMLGIPLDTVILGIKFFPFLSFLIILYILWFESKNKKDSIGSIKHSGPLKPAIRVASIPVLIFIFIEIFFIIKQSLFLPVSEWDAVSYISMNAKIFFYNKSIFNLNIPHPSYPLFTPLIESWITFNLGSWNNYLIKIIFPLSSICFLIICYRFLCHFTDKFWSLLGVALILSSSFFVLHSTIGYNDILIAYFNCTAIILLILWSINKKTNLLILSAIFSGLTGFVKLEGNFYFLIHVFILFIIILENNYSFKNILKNLSVFISINLFINLPFFIYKILINKTAVYGRFDFSSKDYIFSELIDIFYAFGLSLFVNANWNLLWVLLIISIFTGLGRFNKINELKYLSISLALFFILYILFFFFTNSFVCYPLIVSRIVLHFFPICPILIILLNAPLNTKTG